ncbi:protein kinase domain-containing protein [Thalassoroseus pseudoceratinae]|uniref:protein kinase domain-containing protein n=1 Tax=Thalassoroseus pseudoceratinae TaxID=2713176 RepID=UPI001421DB9D|nr:protein kinase [Thalassoroseus pseudoceratinae]
MSVCLTVTVIERFLAGDVSEEEEDRIASHLAECESCCRMMDAAAGHETLERELRNSRDHKASKTSNSGLLPILIEQLKQIGPLDEPSRLPIKRHHERQREVAPNFSSQISAPIDLLSKHGLAVPRSLQEYTRDAVDAKQNSVNDLSAGQLGRFHLIKQLGTGGFGVVWLAKDELLDRVVALKIPRLPSVLDPDQKRRFISESRATASLHHPNIIPVFEAGEYAGFPYIASAYCSGPTLREWMAEQPKTVEPTLAASIVRRLAEAVDHAHESGILHRDIKPANVLLDLSHASGDLAWTPMLTDFGLARVVNADLSLTASSQLAGTPNYMAPEQAIGASESVGPAADVYSLGVILYELLVGRRPIEGNTVAEIICRLTTVTPTPLRRLQPSIPRDLEAVCLHCLEKSPEMRYQSASELADDLHRFLEDRPTQVRPLSVTTKFARWARRNPIFGISFAIAFLALVTILVGLSVHAAQLSKLNHRLTESSSATELARKMAVANGERAQLLLYASDMRLAAQALEEEEPGEARRILERHLPHISLADIRGPEWFMLHQKTKMGGELIDDVGRALYHIVLSPDESQLVTAGEDGIIRFYQTLTSRPLFEIDSQQGEVNGLAFFADGQRLVSSGDDGTIRIWDIPSRNLDRLIRAHDGLAFGVAVTPDGRLVVSCGTDGFVRIWDAATGIKQKEFGGYKRGVEDLAISPDGHWLAAGCQDGFTRIYNLGTGTVWFEHQGEAKISSVTFSRDSRNVAIAYLEGPIGFRVWNLSSRLWAIEQNSQSGFCELGFNPQGTRILLLDSFGTARIRKFISTANEPAPDRVEYVWYIGNSKARGTFTENGRYVFTANRHGQIHRWKIDRFERELHYRPLLSSVSNPDLNDFASTADGTLVLAGSDSLESHVLMEDINSTLPIETHSTESRTWESVDVTQHGRHIAAAGRDSEGLSEIRVWDRLASAETVLVRSQQPCRFSEIRLSPDGRHLAVVQVCRDDAEPSKKKTQLLVFEVDNGELIYSAIAKPKTQMVFSSDGASMIFGVGRRLHFLDLASFAVETHEVSQGPSVRKVAISKTGKWLATTNNEREIQLWNLKNGFKLHATCHGHRGAIQELVFSPDEKTLFSVSLDGTLRGWHVGLGHQLGVLLRRSKGILGVECLPNGSLILRDENNFLVFTEPTPN